MLANIYRLSGFLNIDIVNKLRVIIQSLIRCVSAALIIHAIRTNLEQK